MIEVDFSMMIVCDGNGYCDAKYVDEVLTRTVTLPTINLRGIKFDFDNNLFLLEKEVTQVTIVVAEDGTYRVHAWLEDWDISEYTKESFENKLTALFNSGWSLQ